MNNEERQRVIDAEHLDLLGLFHYITGGIVTAFSALFAFQYILVRLFLQIPDVQREIEQADAPVLAIFGFIEAFATVTIAAGLVYGVLMIVSGWFLRERCRRVFSFVVAIPMLALVPWGTILGVFTLLVLERASVKSIYASRETAS